MKKKRDELLTEIDKKVNITNEQEESGNYIEKIITSNDIRARIISIPMSILKQLGDDINVEVIINNTEKYIFNINRGRNYFGGVTKMMRTFNLLLEDGVRNPKKSKWYYNQENKRIYINLEDDND